MRRVWLGIAFVCLFVGHGRAAVPPQDTANFMLPGCEAALADHNDKDLQLQGVCLGIIVAYSYIGPALPPEVRFCTPATSRYSQGLKIVVDYVKKHPERMADNFRQLALEALHEVWSCPK